MNVPTPNINPRKRSNFVYRERLRSLSFKYSFRVRISSDADLSTGSDRNRLKRFSADEKCIRRSKPDVAVHIFRSYRVASAMKIGARNQQKGRYLTIYLTNEDARFWRSKNLFPTKSTNSSSAFIHLNGVDPLNAIGALLGPLISRCEIGVGLNDLIELSAARAGRMYQLGISKSLPYAAPVESALAVWMCILAPADSLLFGLMNKEGELLAQTLNDEATVRLMCLAVPPATKSIFFCLFNSYSK